MKGIQFNNVYDYIMINYYFFKIRSSLLSLQIDTGLLSSLFYKNATKCTK